MIGESIRKKSVSVMVLAMNPPRRRTSLAAGPDTTSSTVAILGRTT